MKVLYFHQHFSTPQGSTGTRSYEMARKLIERGHEVTMVCGSYVMADSGLGSRSGGDSLTSKKFSQGTGYSKRTDDRKGADFSKDTEPGKDTDFKNGARRGVVDGIDVIEFELPYSNADSFLRRTRTFLSYSANSSLLAFREPYDLLFATSTPLTAGIPGILMKRFRVRKFIFEVRDLWPELPRAMGVITNPAVLKMMSALEWSSYRSADGCIALSPGIREEITARGVHPDLVEMIPNGCDLELFRPAGGSRTLFPGVGEDDFVALFTGAHGIANGLDAALDAAAALKRRGEDAIKLAFIGDGRLKPALIARAREEGLDNCIFMDPVPKVELPAWLAAADAGLMLLKNIPAFYYGTSPNKFFDYISAGLPVLNNYPGWVADLIGEHHCGEAVAPDSPEAFADALVRLRDLSDLEKMGANARRLAEEAFDRQKLSGQFVDFLERVHNGGRKGRGISYPETHTDF